MKSNANKNSFSKTKMIAVLILPIIFVSASSALAKESTKKIVLIAGTKSHGPGYHEYEKGAKLLKKCLDTSPNVKNVKTEVILDGWPKDPAVLDDADTIFLFSDGSDHDEKAHPLLHGDRLEQIDKLMKRGVGFVVIHYSVIVPGKTGGKKFLDWIGGYFDYETGPPPRNWYSKIQTVKSTASPASPDHPISRGLTSFELREEYYYHIRFREKDPRLTPILTTPIPGEKEDQIVAWAVQRKDGGRGFGFTGGHFHANWAIENFRKMVLNALLWTAHVEVPLEGVISTSPIIAAIPPKPAPASTAKKTAKKPESIKAVIVTGHQYPGHKWQETTPALAEALGQDPRMHVAIEEDVEFLAKKELHEYDVVILNYCNWEKPGLSDAAKANFVKYLKDGGGLTIIHFTNGAFHFSLPKAEASDWPEFRNICRRVWNHQKSKTTGLTSGHDPYGPFRVDMADANHPITKGLAPFDTIDELYFRQDGDAPIHVIATAHSKVIKQDAPMAFVYDYGKGRVFQTMLGHAAESIRMPGPAELIRRGTVWAAGKQQIATVVASAEPHGPKPAARPKKESAPAKATGHFGAALNAKSVYATAAKKTEYATPPLTVECWARLNAKQKFNILVANHTKASGRHWELFTGAGNGYFTAYLPGMRPEHVATNVNIADGQWHYLAMVYEPQRVRLFVDAKQVADTKVSSAGLKTVPGPIWFGAYPPGGIGCSGFIDEVRISKVAREIAGVPESPLTAGDNTVGLWHFDQAEKKNYKDHSSLNNPAVVSSSSGFTSPSGPPEGKPDYEPGDPSLKTVLLGRSETESFLSIRLDSAGRIFVGGREALFVYEPDAKGQYGPKKELYRFGPDTWITDVAIRGNDLYVMTPQALYLLPEARLKRKDIQIKRLIWGIPLDSHVSFGGLAWGPQGDLYFSSGDPLLNYGDFNRADHWGHWTIYSQPEGTKTPYTGVGGVFRCKPDGSDFQVVARGTRGSNGLAFDAQWNLFTNDNDHESRPADYVPARLLHVTPHADFSWPRGWMVFKTPDRLDLLEILFTGMGRGVPVGQTYYNETLLPKAYRNNLLLCRWGRLSITRYPLQRRGVSFKTEEHFALKGRNQTRPMGVAVGRGGRIFTAIAYMQHSEWSPTYVSDLVMITRSDDSDYPFAGYEAPTVSPEKLWAELSDPSWWRRYRAHVEILRRGGNLLNEAAKRLERIRDDDPAIAHLPWLAAAGGNRQAGNVLIRFAQHRNPKIRLQAMRALADLPNLKAPRGIFLRGLRDADERVQFAALNAFFRLKGSLPVNEIQRLARSDDSYVRQTSTLLLARKASVEDLLAFCKSSDEPTRLAGVLAVGFRLTVPPADDVPPDDLTVDYKPGNAKMEIQYAKEKINLRSLGRVGSYTMAERWNRFPHSGEEKQLFDMLVKRLEDEAERVRLQAAHFLFLLNDPKSEPLVAKVRAESIERKLAEVAPTKIDRIWLVGPFPDGAEGMNQVHAPETGPIDLSAEYDVDGTTLTWNETSTDQEFELAGPDGAVEHSSFYAYCRLQSVKAQKIMLEIGYDDGVKFWCNGREIWNNAGVRGSAGSKDTVMLDLQVGSNDLLVRIQNVTGASKTRLSYRAVDGVTATLPEKLGLMSLAERLKQAGDGAEIKPEFLDVDWTAAVAEGDVERGRKLFSADGVGCAKCHAITAEQAVSGGPSLVDAGKRFTLAYLVESVLTPSQQIAPIFKATLIETDEGEALTGLIIGETADKIEILLQDATRKSVSKADVTDRRELTLSPMPQGLLQSVDELRDILAYLMSESPKAP